MWSIFIPRIGRAATWSTTSTLSKTRSICCRRQWKPPTWFPKVPGVWQLHCQVDDHMQAGMMARYEVLPAQAAGEKTGRVRAGF